MAPSKTPRSAVSKTANRRSPRKTTDKVVYAKFVKVIKEEQHARKAGKPTEGFDNILKEYRSKVPEDLFNAAREVLAGEREDFTEMEVDDDDENTDPQLGNDLSKDNAASAAPALANEADTTDSKSGENKGGDATRHSRTSSDLEDDCVSISTTYNNPNAGAGTIVEGTLIKWIRPYSTHGYQAIVYDDKLWLQGQSGAKSIDLYWLGALSEVIRSSSKRKSYLEAVQEDQKFENVVGDMSSLPDLISDLACSGLLRRRGWERKFAEYDDGTQEELLGAREAMWIFVKGSRYLKEKGTLTAIGKWYSIGALADKYTTKATIALRSELLGLGAGNDRVATNSPSPPPSSSPQQSAPVAADTRAAETPRPTTELRDQLNTLFTANQSDLEKQPEAIDEMIRKLQEMRGKNIALPTPERTPPK